MEEYGEDVGAHLDYVKSVVKYILNNSGDKLPIKKSDIVANTLNGNGKIFTNILRTVREDLKEIYGFNFLEVPDTKPVSFISVSEFPAASINEYTKKQQSQITLLFIILTYIFMKGTPIKEENLYHFLEKLHISVENNHEYFGSNIKKLISETFVRQLYLKKEKITTETSGDEIQYSWGYRSTLEFPKKEILSQTSALMGRAEICFIQQHREVHGTVDDAEMEDISSDPLT